MASDDRSRSLPSAARGSLAVAALLFTLGISACGSSKPTVVGSWTLSSFTYRATTVEAATPPATIEFAKDGKVTGNTGCNQFGGRWTTDATELRFSAIGLTSRACNDSNGSLTAQESAMELTFSRPQTYSIDGNRLTIGNADGSVSATFTRA